MYRQFFGIAENPFSNTPDPKYLYMSERHKEALAHLIYGVEGNSGFVLLTGEVGLGKTTLCRYLSECVPDNVDLALCINPKLTEAELLENICDDFGVKYKKDSSVRELTAAINQHLLGLYARGRRAVLIIDEAQNMDFDLLEQVRMLTNLETTHNKLLQIILIGQTELKIYLEQPKVRQIAQRITARYHLDPMTFDDVKAYIEHRASVGGLPGDLFRADAIDVIYQRSRGIPRLINSISERCLLGAYARDARQITADLARRAADEVLGADQKGPAPANRTVNIAVAVAFLFIVAFAYVAIDPLEQNIAPKISRAPIVLEMKSTVSSWLDVLRSSGQVAGNGLGEATSTDTGAGQER